MKKIFFFLVTALIGLNVVAQNETGFIKGDNNIEYKIFPQPGGAQIQYGNFIKMHVVQLYKGATDSVLYDSKDFPAPIQPVDTVNLPMYYYSILMQLKNNDSVVMRIVVDSAYKNSKMPMPAEFESGKYLYTAIKVIDLFTSKATADSVIIAEQNAMAAKEAENNVAVLKEQSVTITQYLASKKIGGFIKTPQGLFIKIIKKGVGKNAMANDKVKINYTGQNLAGVKFDSNTDPKFGHLTPYEVHLSQNPPQVIDGWEEGIKYLNKGCKAQIFIPSPLAYGSRGYPPAIAPNEILMFDMELVSINAGNTPAVKPATKPTKPVVKTKAKPKTK